MVYRPIPIWLWHPISHPEYLLFMWFAERNTSDKTTELQKLPNKLWVGSKVKFRLNQSPKLYTHSIGTANKRNRERDSSREFMVVLVHETKREAWWMNISMVYLHTRNHSSIDLLRAPSYFGTRKLLKAHSRTHTYIRTHTPTQAHTHTHTDGQTRTNTRPQCQTRIHTHTHTAHTTQCKKLYSKESCAPKLHILPIFTMQTKHVQFDTMWKHAWCRPLCSQMNTYFSFLLSVSLVILHETCVKWTNGGYWI